eukprot:7722205-Pyramimonas_sp.AAC.1
MMSAAVKLMKDYMIIDLDPDGYVEEKYMLGRPDNVLRAFCVKQFALVLLDAGPFGRCVMRASDISSFLDVRDSWMESYIDHRVDHGPDLMKRDSYELDLKIRSSVRSPDLLETLISRRVQRRLDPSDR